jgi:ribonucleotide monophosphatase NagD (HAD superfamily)
MWLEQQGKEVFFVTNSALKTVDDLVQKMKKLGYENPTPAKIFGTARIISSYMKVNYPGIKKVFVIGSKALRLALEEIGIEVLGADQHIFSPQEPISVD